ncbi:MAG TPA: hypothetical protein VGT24_11130 [Candidatus Acidoferrales bacterium]|nr:hypothetical protein [Candidatus Acidoferrales bacterium]
MTQKITAFVAKSFDKADEGKIAPITGFLAAFEKLGFIVQDAEANEVESVSAKVRKLIDESDALVGIFTKKHPVYRFRGRWTTAIDALRMKLTPYMWSPPPWVLQESGYALKGNKSLILFRETNVDIPGLQGDLEYIPYDPQDPAPAFLRAAQMINDLIAKAGNVQVETIVRSDSAETRGSDAAEPPKAVGGEPSNDEMGAKEDNLMTRIFELIDLLTSREWETAQKGFEDGLQWVKDHHPESELFWRCVYQRQLFNVGRADGLTELRKLAFENKDKYLPLSYVALCLSDLGEYDESASQYLAAASVSDPDQRASLEIRASEALQKAKRTGEASEILFRLLNAEYAKEPKTETNILQHLYSLLKESGEKFAAFSIAELALHRSPEDSDFRFSLAFDYEDSNQSHLSLYHYRIICDNDDRNPGAFNNLGVASTKSGLPVLAAQRYRRAYELGDTLSASNLAYKYVEAGFSDDAVNLLKSAQIKDNCVPEVPRALAHVHEKIKDDNVGQDKILAKASDHRAFLLSFSEGILLPDMETPEGAWRFPVVEIDLRRVGQEIRGSREVRTQVNPDYGFALILSGVPPTPITRTEKFEFIGTLTGRSCKFKLSSSKHDDPPSALSALSGAGGQTIEGYILFGKDGRSGKVAELKDGKPEKYYDISKVVAISSASASKSQSL